MNRNKLKILKEFVNFCKEELNIQTLPKISLTANKDFVLTGRSFGEYNPVESTVRVFYPTRNLADVCRSLAHELCHHRQNELGLLYNMAGETGTDIENDANAMAGVIMREFGKVNSQIYGLDTADEIAEHLVNEVGEDLSSAYDFKYIGGSDPTYTFNTGQTKYKVVFKDEGGGTYERIYAPIQKKPLGAGVTTGEGKAIPVNATVMAITLDFLEKNKDWYILTVHPIDPRRHRLVTNFIDKNLPKDKYDVEDVEGVLSITRKIR